MLRLRPLRGLGLAMFLVACGGGTTGTDDGGGTGPTDAGTTDAGPGPGDAGSTPLDGGPGPSDAGVDAGPSECTLPPACDAPLPDLGATTDWRHTSSRITAAIGSPRHRGRDLFLTDGDAQWALAKFAYGIDDDDIKDEDVDIYLLRGCEGSWEHLGVATTTRDGDHATVEGVEDTGGRVYFRSPRRSELGRGRHRLLFVVQADHSVAEQYVEVVAPGTRFAITDVDSTQTERERRTAPSSRAPR
ncbi:MAG: hypothetical protein R3B82_23750 [Sandaracinaceae bacterium]